MYSSLLQMHLTFENFQKELLFKVLFHTFCQNKLTIFYAFNSLSISFCIKRYLMQGIFTLSAFPFCDPVANQSLSNKCAA